MDWRREPESNWPGRICNPLHNRFAIAPGVQVSHRQTKGKPGGLALRMFGAGNETRTRDLILGKVALYQLSYSRIDLSMVGTSNEARIIARES